MNSCSRALAIAAAVIAWSAPASALSVHAVYRTACDRELGVILKVEKRHVHLLKLDGSIEKIPRHEIVSITYYPMSQLPLAKLPERPSVPAIRVETLFHGEVVELATGWPVDYSETKVVFLLSTGKDIVIEKDSIWSLQYQRTLPPLAQPTASLESVEFAHPQTAGFCASGDGDGAADGRRVVFAQQILNDRIVIKRELDRLFEGYVEIEEFEQDQKFYPTPHVYKDRTDLGLWVSALSRYGASKTRSNNFTPVLVDELHLGPFRYQHLFLSGAAPNPFLLHAEAQTQIYYRFKAAYIHASVMLDPNLVLVGTKYGWRAEDLEDETLDDRINEWLAIEFGFDYGPFAVELSPLVGGQSVVKTPDLFNTKGDHNLWRAGVRFTQRLWAAELWAGATRTDDYDDAGNVAWEYRYGRANLTVEPSPRFGALASAIYRHLDYGSGAGSYTSSSTAAALQAWYAVTRRVRVAVDAIAELQSRGSDGAAADRRVLPSFGAFTSLSF